MVIEYVLKGWLSEKEQVDELARDCVLCFYDFFFYDCPNQRQSQFHNRQQRETLHPHDIPGLPWQVVGTDLFEYGGQTYLLVTDFYSKYFEIEQLCQNTAICVINNLKKIFGIPEKGCQRQRTAVQQHRTFVNHEFKKFAEEWGFSHTTSSPGYPQSNGSAERAVQTAKRILKKASAKTHLRDC